MRFSPCSGLLCNSFLVMEDIRGSFVAIFFGVSRMTAEQIQQIKEKYKNPLYMQHAINNVAEILANEYVKHGLNIELKEKKTMAENSKIKELENVLLDQIEKLNDDSIFDDEEKAKIMIEKSKAISDLSRNFTEIQRMKLEFVRHAEHNGTLYTKYLGIE